MLRRMSQINRKSVLLTWLLSYMAVLLLPIVISIIVYVQSSQALENEIHAANESLLKQARTLMDNQFETMERLNYELTWNVRIRELLYSHKYTLFPNDYTYDLYEITKTLNVYKNSYSLVDSFYIYLADQNMVLLPDVYRDATFAYKLMHDSAELPLETWKTHITQKNFKGFIPMWRVTEDGSRRKAVAYVSTHPPDNNRPVATNVIMIDPSRILHTIEHVGLFNKGHVLILNEDNEVLVSSSEEPLPLDFLFTQRMATSDFFFWEYGGERYEVSYVQSVQSKLKYVSIIPSRLFWQKAEQVRNLTYMSILISLLGGGMLTYFFLRKNYNPVRRLVQAFTTKADSDTAGGYNEFQFLQQAVDQTFLAMDRFTLERKKQMHIVRSNFIVRLLKGKLDGHIPIDEALTTFNMRLMTNDFAVMLLYVEDNTAFMESIMGKEPADKLRLQQFIMQNVLEELSARHHQGFVAELDDMSACLINFSDWEPDHRQQELLRIATEAQSFLRTKYHIQLTLSVSGVHSSLAGLSQAYVEALDAMEYKLVMGSKEILCYWDIHKHEEAGQQVGYYYPLQVEQQLINYIKIGDFPSAQNTLDEIIDRNFRGAAVSVPIARCLMLNLVSTLVKTLSEIGHVQESLPVPNRTKFEKRVEKLARCATIQDMQGQMAELLKQVCEYTSTKRQQNILQSRQKLLSDLIRQVHSFIEHNYHSPSLNITMIGNHFDMKPAYLSKLFKDSTGEGLLDGINKTRIAHAKQLVAEAGKTIGEVSVCVGFNDVNAFIRTFKKYEGITPGKYKETLGRQAD
ncbi:helix-turn-helix domain-containing protein [Paenibacillus xerothermodurans]|uniref:AraC family transcriptional regulator n=1 Tax=Paenibacillus xerothermodurans TaxID=1977292 RepID=A0A2W1NXA6_PAEXE|nr:helix-turn-helix domain-containing protein [Paenibacillus xerothermodurans]PZE22356.1 AraC family transcriptional regulator [Paenibacillus xerothermodurans]